MRLPMIRTNHPKFIQRAEYLLQANRRIEVRGFPSNKTWAAISGLVEAGTVRIINHAGRGFALERGPNWRRGEGRR